MQPKKESIMISKWKEPTKPLVSVICPTYNHQEYIEDALKGFLIQETDFPFEIIIHDDASNDDTPNIIKKYADKYPKIIRPILQTENQQSKGRKSLLIAARYATGQYVALCEGDDYWTDQYKLKLQIAGLENYSNCQLSFHCATKHNLKTGKFGTLGRYREKDGIVSASEIIRKKNGSIPTASCVIKKDAFEDFIKFIDKNQYVPIGDIFLQAIGASYGGGLYIDKCMSYYRFLGPNSWTLNSLKKENYFPFVKNRIKGFNELLVFIKYNFEDDIKYVNRKFVMDFIKSSSSKSEKKKILDISLSCLKSYQIILSYLILYFPTFLIVYKAIVRTMVLLRKYSLLPKLKRN